MDLKTADGLTTWDCCGDGNYLLQNSVGGALTSQCIGAKHTLFLNHRFLEDAQI